jgi:hypothetical protein
MLIIVLVCVLILNAIFWGLIPVSKHSPHQMMLDFFEINYKPDVYFHLFVGTIFYILAVILIHNGNLFFSNESIHDISSE